MDDFAEDPPPRAPPQDAGRLVLDIDGYAGPLDLLLDLAPRLSGSILVTNVGFRVSWSGSDGNIQQKTGVCGDTIGLGPQH